MHRFTRGQPGGEEPRGVRALLERPSPVPEHGWAQAATRRFDADPALEWVPIVGTDNRPVALAGRPSVLAGEPRLAGIERVEPDLGFAEAARRAMGRTPSERLVPFVRCDSRGRYVAIVRIERLVGEIADAHPHQPLASRSP